ncbi:winged helix-turn-helix transcriptional regulator [Ureibacillus thermosphaericus]|uniref:winged helix-turn-helix transcriptional regulator n=1 Tax=Ureibacillus thermosphaericus TaxID=51173 RepID=UPI001E30A943|nr:winged helix-turn-helix transcriptional regulator [Ureibacillus thermosphaericus]
MDDFIKAFKKMMETDLSLINILNELKDENGVANISQKELSNRLGISPSNISKRINRLLKYSAIRKIKNGQYQLLSGDLRDTPYVLVFDLLLLISKKPELYSDYKSQSEELKVELNEIQRAWGFINNSFGSGL